jgi:hypothetical protein
MTSGHASSRQQWAACLFWCLTLGLAAALAFFVWKGYRIRSEQARHPMTLFTDSGALNIPPAPAPGKEAEGMKFVASKQGKKYYPVGSAQAENLKPENRLYFPDAAAAEAAGYVR